MVIVSPEHLSRSLVSDVTTLSHCQRHYLQRSCNTRPRRKRVGMLGFFFPASLSGSLEETRFPGMPYIVFPGNVGGPAALTEAVQRLSLKLTE